MPRTKKQKPEQKPDEASGNEPEPQGFLDLYQDSLREHFPENHPGLLPGLFDKPAPEGKLPESQALFTLLKRHRKGYEGVLGMILNGSSIRNAFGSIGVPEPTVNYWVSQGAAHLHKGEDTYYARLASDLMRVKSAVKADCEMRVKTKDPKGWLENEASGTRWAPSREALPVVGPEEQLESQNLETPTDEAETPLIDFNRIAREAVAAAQDCGVSLEPPLEQPKTTTPNDQDPQEADEDGEAKPLENNG